MESIITAMITGGVTLLGVLIANEKNQAVTETKLDELTREVREHNNFANSGLFKRNIQGGFAFLIHLSSLRLHA